MHHYYMELEARDRQEALLREARERRSTRAIKSTRRDTSPRSLLCSLLWVSWCREEYWICLAAEQGSDPRNSVASTERS